MNGTYVDLRNNQAVQLDLKKSRRLREQSVNVLSSVSAITVGPSLNLTKQRPVGLFTLFNSGPESIKHEFGCGFYVRGDF